MDVILKSKHCLPVVAVMADNIIIVDKDCLSVPGLSDRILMTLQIADRRGYGLSLSHLSKILVKGEVNEEIVKHQLSFMKEVSHNGDVFCLKGREELLAETKRRLDCNRVLGGIYEIKAKQLASQYASLCPFIRCIAIAGSMASGGFSEEDDIDFNIFVEKGTKYTVYFIGIFLALKYALMNRRKPLSYKSATPFLPKFICINVIWEEHEALPYMRRDRYMAYELLRQKPVFGLRFYNEVLHKNMWVRSYFPQIYGSAPNEIHIKKTLMRKIIRLFYSNNIISHTGELLSKKISYVLWSFVQFSRRNNTAARQRVKWVRSMQRPYALFGDRS